MNIKPINNFTIETPEGWCSFEGIKKSIIPYHFIVWFEDNTYLKGADSHLVQYSQGDFWEISLLEPGDKLMGGKIVKKVEYIEEELEVYDIIKIDNNTSSYFSENIIHHNCAFIEGIAEIWASVQQTLATGGGAIVLSTPYGTGNWFHKTFTAAEEGTNDFLPIKLPWFVHPERDEAWRKKQDDLLGDPRLAAQECDALFNTSGDIVFHSEWLEFIEQTTIQEPTEKRGADQNLWVWEPADYSREYVVLADVARGDGKDFSTFHVIDVLTNTQVAEYKGQLPTKEFGYFLTAIATEYNMALLIVENNNIGWATLDAILERDYKNLYYSPKSDMQGNMGIESYFNKFESSANVTPGFTNSLRTRPLIINKFREYVGDKSVTIKSKRLLGEMKVFVWKNGRPEAQSGYNDDLVIPFAIGMYLRDTTLKFKQQSQDLTRAMLGNIQSNKPQQQAAYFSKGNDNPYSMKTKNGGMEDLSWLL